MPLCSICRSIPLENLPPFPEKSYEKNITGLRYIHNLFPNSNLTEAQALARVKYHGSLLDLQHAAAAGCELCQLVKDQADALLAEIESLDQHQRILEGSPPTFNMQLTRRPEGGDGFWVLSECHKIFEIEAIGTLPIAAIGFRASEFDPLAVNFRGRPITPAPDPEVSPQIKRWIADCDADHQCCPSTSPLPNTVIDVGCSDSESSVMVVHLDDGIRGRYTALSYLHERGIQSHLYKASLSIGHCGSSPLNVTALPPLFQDAIRVTRGLGIKYIWIDAICISEEEAGNLERDSEAFASIYTNATLTIAATGSPSDSEGLFFHRPARPSISVPHTTSGGISGNLEMQVLPLDKEVLREPYIEMASEPLRKGLWAFQERVLSARILHFASDQIYFECMKHFASEDGLLLGDRFHTIRNVDQATGLQRWFDLAWAYGECDLTRCSDRLPALANIARAYQVILEDDYVAGSWKKSLVQCLYWQSVRGKPADLYGAPSWSWASVDCRAGIGFRTPTWEPMATIHNLHVELDSPDPFGNVKAALINLEAPLVPLTLAETQGPTGHMFFRAKQGSGSDFYASLDTIPRTHAASAELVRRMELFAIVLAESQVLDCRSAECERVSVYHGIIVSPVDGRERQMKRVGSFIANPEDLALGSLHSHDKVITLV